MCVYKWAYCWEKNKITDLPTLFFSSPLRQYNNLFWPNDGTLAHAHCTQIRITKANFNCEVQMLVRKCFPMTHFPNDF